MPNNTRRSQIETLRKHATPLPQVPHIRLPQFVQKMEVGIDKEARPEATARAVCKRLAFREGSISPTRS